jgi:hypothetical protein
MAVGHKFNGHGYCVGKFNVSMEGVPSTKTGRVRVSLFHPPHPPRPPHRVPPNLAMVMVLEPLSMPPMGNNLQIGWMHPWF